jgi:hypothetical protein
MNSHKTGEGKKHLENPETISSVLRSKGLHISSHDRRFSDKVTGKRFQAVANFKFEEMAKNLGVEWAELEKRGWVIMDEGFHVEGTRGPGPALPPIFYILTLYPFLSSLCICF